MDVNKRFELSDDALDQVVGGVSVGDTVTCSSDMIAYCSNCGRLLKNYSVTITGVRGVLNGKRSIGSPGTAAAISPASSKRRFWTDRSG